MKREPELLKQWTVDATVPANFNSAVWRRIEDRRPIRLTEAMRQFTRELFARRVVVGSYLTIAVAVGLAAAHVQSSKVLRDRDSQLEARYVQSVDPYARPTTP